MHSRLILIFLLHCLVSINCNSSSSSPSFLNLPENIIVEYENASSYVYQQNHNGEHMMGVPDDHCDNAKVIKVNYFIILNLCVNHLGINAVESETKFS
jgi:hypothetical protein